ncbi:MAG: hypothetical protein NXI31_22165 [bacterium]|nr:hypothetical protein [bacterium]
MRATAIFATAALLSGCSSTMFLEPRVTVSPYYAVYQLRGDASVQTDPGGGNPIQNNPRQLMSVFGMDTHEDDVGFRAEVGDGFGGLRVDYYRLDMSTSKANPLSADWGMLLEDDLVRMRAQMDELRISYIEPLFETTTEWREEDLTLRFGAGGEFAYRDLTLRAFTDDLARRQNVPIAGQNLAINVRFRAEWQDLAFDVDYAISPHLIVRGDYNDVNQNLEMRASYAIPLRDVTFFAGFRYNELNGNGRTDMVDYDADLVIDGFQFGMTVSL